MISAPLTTGSAGLSQCERYRYWLTRDWDPLKPDVCFIMLNPSTADASIDDPTIRRCIGFARAWGYGGLAVVNLFAWRATNPRDLETDVSELQTALNNDAILAGTNDRRTVAAWGAHKAAIERAGDVMRILNRKGRKVECLGVTKHGHPRHPLYVSAMTKLIPFTPNYKEYSR